MKPVDRPETVWVPIGPPGVAAAATRAREVARLTGAWRALLAGSPEARRAARYATWRRRGDAPPARDFYWLAVDRLLAPGEGDAEVWLDAASAASSF